jgi:predicted ATPase
VCYAALVGAARGKTNLGEPAALVGRDGDRAGLAERFDAGARLVTIVGPGGIGKTRLAQAFAHEHAAAYAAHGGGGAWWCDLTEAQSAMAICAAVGAALGVALDPSVGEDRVIARLGAAIARRKQVLLVLDNLEHLVEPGAQAIRAWLAAAPGVRFLVTSRVALGLADEHRWPLAGLALPPAGASAEAVRSADAVELFVRRARQVRPALAVGAPELAAIAEIVRRCDGLPLAIELAAARLAALSPAELRDRLAASLELLARPADAGRHGSIRRVVLDSVAALDADTRACLAACAVFHGGFTLEAAEAALAAPGRDVLARLEALVAASLLRVHTPETASRARFAPSEPVREVAVEELAARADAGAPEAARHAAYYAALARRLADRAAERGDRAALAELALELENVVAAHRSALAAGDGATALALAVALDPLLVARGMFRLRSRMLDDALAATAGEGPTAAPEPPDDVSVGPSVRSDRAPATAAPEPPDDVSVGPSVRSDRATAVVARGHTRRELGDHEGARVELERGRALARACGDRELEALAVAWRAEIVETAGATEAARAELALALALVAGSTAPLARTREADLRARLGHALRREAAVGEARRELERALELYRAVGHVEGEAAMCYELAVLELFHRRHRSSRARFDEGLALATAAGARPLAAALVSGRAILLQEMGELDEAIAQHAVAVQEFRDLGNPHREGSALYYLATAYLERGELAQGRALLDQATAAVGAVGAARYLALVGGARAAALALDGLPAEAEVALAEADAAAAQCASEGALLATLAIHRLQLVPAEAHADAVREARAIAERAVSDDPRYALRLLERRGVARGPALVVRAGAAAFRLPGAAADVDLARRLPLRRILAALASRRRDAPGEGLALDDVLAIGWPGEQVGYAAAVNRVHVALTTLRKLGLRGVLVTGEHGYALSPAVPVVIEEPAAV